MLPQPTPHPHAARRWAASDIIVLALWRKKPGTSSQERVLVNPRAYHH